MDHAQAIAVACGALAAGDVAAAAATLTREYPFAPVARAGRTYTALQSLRVFVRDGRALLGLSDA